MLSSLLMAVADGGLDAGGREAGGGVVGRLRRRRTAGGAAGEETGAAAAVEAAEGLEAGLGLNLSSLPLTVALDLWARDMPLPCCPKCSWVSLMKVSISLAGSSTRIDWTVPPRRWLPVFRRVGRG